MRAAVFALTISVVAGWTGVVPPSPRSFRTAGALRTAAAKDESLFQVPISDWDEDISAIATRYLQGKYTACDLDGENCRALCDQEEISKVLTEILPPVSEEELKSEVDEIMATFKGAEVIDMGDFLDALKTNKYWAESGELVVKELMYLDCLQSSYASKKALLSDDDLRRSFKRAVGGGHAGARGRVHQARVRAWPRQALDGVLELLRRRRDLQHHVWHL